MSIPKKLEDLTESQKKFIKDHALELFNATIISGDSVEQVLASTCGCCEARREFLKKLFAVK